MALSNEFLEELLYEDESLSLDVKEKQYPFEKATKEQKSELLKDILAFVNAWRRSDAFILIGVKEVRGGRSIVVGVSEHLDDAKLQQFVNSKTNRAPQFSYHEGTLDRKDVGILLIPLQDRPVYLRNDYGRLTKQTVYVRRGSSTAKASPDEVSRMASSTQPTLVHTPTLDLQFYDRRTDQMLGNRVELHTVNIELPQQHEIPKYAISLGGGYILPPLPDMSVDGDYYRKYARYLQVTGQTGRVELAVANRSSVTAVDACVEVTVVGETPDCTILDAAEIPSKPSKGWRMNLAYAVLNPDIQVERLSGKWLITSSLGKIQPKTKAYTCTGVFLGARVEEEIELRARIFADNLPTPLTFVLTVHIIPERRRITLEKLLSLANSNTD